MQWKGFISLGKWWIVPSFWKNGSRLELPSREVQGLGGAAGVGPSEPRLKTPARELQVACCETFERLPRLLLQNASGCGPMGQLGRLWPACFSPVPSQ
jgi:hypothetical protein